MFYIRFLELWNLSTSDFRIYGATFATDEIWFLIVEKGRGLSHWGRSLQARMNRYNGVIHSDDHPLNKLYGR